MSVLQESLTWSNVRPLWQQDALRRLARAVAALLKPKKQLRDKRPGQAGGAAGVAVMNSLPPPPNKRPRRRTDTESCVGADSRLLRQRRWKVRLDPHLEGRASCTWTRTRTRRSSGYVVSRSRLSRPLVGRVCARSADLTSICAWHRCKRRFCATTAHTAEPRHSFIPQKPSAPQFSDR